MSPYIRVSKHAWKTEIVCLFIKEAFSLHYIVDFNLTCVPASMPVIDWDQTIQRRHHRSGDGFIFITTSPWSPGVWDRLVVSVSISVNNCQWIASVMGFQSWEYFRANCCSKQKKSLGEWYLLLMLNDWQSLRDNSDKRSPLHLTRLYSFSVLIILWILLLL